MEVDMHVLPYFIILLVVVAAVLEGRLKWLVVGVLGGVGLFYINSHYDEGVADLAAYSRAFENATGGVVEVHPRKGPGRLGYLVVRTPGALPYSDAAPPAQETTVIPCPFVVEIDQKEGDPRRWARFVGPTGRATIPVAGTMAEGGGAWKTDLIAEIVERTCG